MTATALRICDTRDATADRRVGREWISVQVASLRSGLSIRTIQLHCQREWRLRGMAEEVAGEWRIDPSVDGRLQTPGYLNHRDLGQLASADGTRHEDIEEAKARKQCIDRWFLFPQTPNREIAFARFIAVLLGDESLAKAIGGKFSYSTICSWTKSYRDGGIVSLIPQYTKRGRGQTAHVGAEALDELSNLILARDVSLPVAMAIVKGKEAREHRGEPEWALPSESIVRRELRPLLPPIVRRFANKGERTAKADCVPKMQRDFESIASGEEYVGDERTLDIWCRILTARGWRAVRLKLTVWMDMRSRVIVGWKLAAHANSQTILGALKPAIRIYGKPRILRTDWGEDYRKAARHGELRYFDGERIGGILDDLGIEVRRVAPYTPYAKPIESFFGGFKDSFDKLFDTFFVVDARASGMRTGRNTSRPISKNYRRWTRSKLRSPSGSRFITTRHTAPSISSERLRWKQWTHSAPSRSGSNRTPCSNICFAISLVRVSCAVTVFAGMVGGTATAMPGSSPCRASACSWRFSRTMQVGRWCVTYSVSRSSKSNASRFAG